MTIIGFNFSKVDAERKKGAKGKVNISNNISIKNVEKIDLNLGKNKDKALKFVFSFSTSYKPKLGHINFEGELVYMSTPENLKKVEKEWKKKKKIPKEVAQEVMSNIVEKANLEAIILSRTVSLPSPVPLPKVKSK